MTHIDLKAFAIGEMSVEDKRQAAEHVAGCEVCREELAGLQATLSSMAALREEEVPRRIAFVSDKVFEPRWWQRLFNPTFASACILAAAILAHGFAAPPAMNASVQGIIDQAVAREISDRMALLEQKDKEMTQRYKAVMNLVTY